MTKKKQSNSSLELKKEILLLRRDIAELKQAQQKSIISPALEGVLIALGSAQIVKTINSQ